MNEDLGVCEFAKKRLEEGLSGDPPGMEAILRAASTASAARMAARRSGLARVLALAAALVVVCVFTIHFMSSRPGLSGDAVLAGAIGLLREVDGGGGEEFGQVGDYEVADMLLALQDAPYENAVSGLFD